MTTKEHNDLMKSIKTGTHKQFIYDKNKNKVMCKCGLHAVWFRNEAFLCSGITINSGCKY